MTYGSMPPAPPGFAHGFSVVDGLRLHHVTGGAESGRCIVLLAGFPESWFSWRRVMPRLAERFRVVAIDLPGQGDSDRPLDGYDTETVAERVRAHAARLGLRRYALVAHDVGAWVAFPYALKYGPEIEALAIMDAGIPGVTLPDLLPSAPDKAWKTWHFAFHAVADLPEALIAGREEIYLDWFFRNKMADPARHGPEAAAEYLRLFRAPGGLRAGLAFYRAAARSAEQNRRLAATERLRMPVLALGADQGSIPDIAACLRPHADDVRGETIPDCGHFQPEEQPDRVADALLRFLG